MSTYNIYNIGIIIIQNSARETNTNRHVTYATTESRLIYTLVVKNNKKPYFYIAVITLSIIEKICFG